MSAAAFNPFADRLSRDIRNELSRQFAQSLREGNLNSVTECAAAMLTEELAKPYREYIEQRLTAYQSSFTAIEQLGNSNPLLQGIILWNQQLFFEVHEILEEAWHTARGQERLLLQALIRAAGVYIKLEVGMNAAAWSMADKALPVLEGQQDVLEEFCTIAPLLIALHSRHNTAPHIPLTCCR